MPRPTKRVKTYGAVDLHFHGAFGIDLMSAKAPMLDELSSELWKRGVAGICPTTLSASKSDLLDSVSRLGAWIRSDSAPGAKPLGIHLEGPFLNSDSAGAHPPAILRLATLEELDRLWVASQKTLRIITLAPETLSPEERLKVIGWAKPKKIRLSIGHTRCTQQEASDAFKSGFSGVTHAWNAMAYHHREPGVLGAAFEPRPSSRLPRVYVELIPDEIHTHPTLIDWTLALHPRGTFFVSDAAPAACTDGSHFHAFGDLECRNVSGASRLPDGSLAGGGRLLSETFALWIEREAKRRKVPIEKLLREHLDRTHVLPLKAISGAKSFLKRFPIAYEIALSGPGKGRISVLPLSSRR